jgi:hypothetical protein
VERFYLFQKFWNKTKNFCCCFLAKAKRSIFSKIFGTKPKLFDVFQLFFFAKAKRFYLIQKLRNNTKTF